MDPLFERGYYRLTRFGFSGSRFIVRQVFERDLLISEETHPWLETPLGLCHYPISTTAFTATGRTCHTCSAGWDSNRRHCSLLFRRILSRDAGLGTSGHNFSPISARRSETRFRDILAHPSPEDSPAEWTVFAV